MTIREWLQSAKARLSTAGFESTAMEAQLLAAHVLLVDRSWLLAHSDEPFPVLAGESVLARRLLSEPLAYILGWREFYGRRFGVTPAVLIPRHETEVLVETALEYAKKIGRTNLRVLDLGTGSGCVGITLKLEMPSLVVVASDLSENALELAGRNGADLGAELDFVLSDRFESLSGNRFDLIVTNPPYIGRSEPLPTDVVDFEPHLALFSGESGLEFYKALAADAALHLFEGGLLLMEVGYRQALAVEELFTDRGWKLVETRSDLGGVPRVVVVSAD